jgi:hypothetical protein
MGFQDVEDRTFSHRNVGQNEGNVIWLKLGVRSGSHQNKKYFPIQQINVSLVIHFSFSYLKVEKIAKMETR